MPLLLRITLAAFSLVLAMACGYGFLATFEPGNNIAWRIGYGGFGLLFVAVAVWLLVPRRTITR